MTLALTCTQKKRINMHTHEYEYLFGIIFMCNSNICTYDIYDFLQEKGILGNMM